MMPSENHDTGDAPLVLAFKPVHKLFLGIAVGVVAGLLLFVVTMAQVMLDNREFPLFLLAQYFLGYSVSAGGAFVGLGWGFFTGFVAGWFVAFVRNLVVTATIFLLRTKAELAQTSDFLDHI